MPIVTISRGSGSGGLALAEKLAAELGFTLVSREEIVHEAARFGAPEERLQEALLRPPKFLDRLQHERRRYLFFVQAALCNRALKGRIVYHGNAGHLLLPGISHVVCVRLIAPLEYRVGMLRSERGMSVEEAIEYIHKVDRQRERWTRFLYGVDWLDPHLYDVSINLRTLDVVDVVEPLAAIVRSPKFQPTPESRKAMEDLALASRVQAALAADPRTASVDIKVKASGGLVQLRGKVRPASMLSAVLDVVESVEGVVQVDREDLAAPEYTV